MRNNKVPDYGLKAKPTIQNRYKKLKSWYHANVLMRSQSGFGWDDEKVCIDAHKDVWDPFVENNKSCKGYNRVPFPQFFDIAPVFANGRATASMGFSSNDRQTIFADGDGSSDDEEGPSISLEEMNNLVVDEERMDMINDGVEARTEDNKKRPAALAGAGGPEKKKKKG
ncbi:hypothetical protein LINGRAHAP2_LOCUS14563 [Linum grandiflorum]